MEPSLKTPLALYRRIHRIIRVIKWMGLTLLTICVAGLLLTLYLKSRPLPAPNIPFTTKIYDVHGQLLTSLDQGENREPISLSEIPSHLKEAIIAAEDHRFYSHWGISPKGILRATWINLREGKVVQGASTITQQLARNLYLTHDRTWTRKWHEMLLAIQLELHFSKDEILEMYLNQIYYGHGAYGIKRAAHVYFGKEPKELTLAESALLAGVLRSPKGYSPFIHPKQARRRQSEVLQQMVHTRAISKKEANIAAKAPLSLNQELQTAKVQSPYFRDYIIQEATRMGIPESQLYSEGLKIYTTLDSKMQKEAEKAIQHYLSTKEGLEGALIAIEPETGAIRAMVGGREYHKSQYNRVFARRQPGSTFKPILYLAALRHGFTPVTQLPSKPMSFSFGQEVYRPTNYNHRYANRPITLREAIAWSDNIYAVNTHFRIGRDKAIQTARLLGIRSSLKPVPSLALGTETVTPFELTQAYATLAAGGKRTDPFGILRIEGPDGTLITKRTVRSKQVIPKSQAYVLTDLLQSVFQPGGTAYRVKQIFPSSAAGKTGTTEWDGWLAGYTPQLATTVWVGYDRGKKLTPGDSRLAQTIWATFMRDALGMQSESFPIPPDVIKVKVDPTTGSIATKNCPQVQQEVFVQGTEPTQICTVHTRPSSKKDPSFWKRIKDWWLE